MCTLAEIEQAAETLPPEQQQELLLFLATRLHGRGGALPPPRDIPREQIENWIADDEAGNRRFLGACGSAKGSSRALFDGAVAQGRRPLPLVPAIGSPIAQREIDDALDAD